VLWAGRGGKAAREQRRPRVAVAGGSAGVDGGGDVVSHGAAAVGHGFLPPLRRCGGGALFGYGGSSSPSRSDSNGHPVGCWKFDRAHGCP
jgi:hypothetical protein